MQKACGEREYSRESRKVGVEENRHEFEETKSEMQVEGCGCMALWPMERSSEFTLMWREASKRFQLESIMS